MDKYSKGKIYFIRNKIDDNLIYVGSTIEEYLSKRFCKHKTQYSCSLNKYINDPNNNTCWDEWYIELYEEYPCDNKLQLVRRENEIIREKATINKIGFRTEEMKKQQIIKWRDENKEKIKEKTKEYIEKNREKILKKKAEYNEKNKEYKNNYMKERYKQKKEQILEYEKQRRDKNKERINCDCGSSIFKYKLCDHLKTKKHIDYINSLNNTPTN